MNIFVEDSKFLWYIISLVLKEALTASEAALWFIPCSAYLVYSVRVG